MKQAIEVTLNKAQMADIKKAIKQNSVSVSHDIKELRKQIDRLNYRLNDIHNLMLKETNVDGTKVQEYEKEVKELKDRISEAVGTSTSTV